MIYISILFSLITLIDSESILTDGMFPLLIFTLSVLYVIVTIPSSFGLINCREVWKYREYRHLLERGSRRPATKEECVGVLHLCEALRSAMDIVVSNKRTFTMICCLNPILIIIWSAITSYPVPELDRCCRIATHRYTDVGESV